MKLRQTFSFNGEKGFSITGTSNMLYQNKVTNIPKMGDIEKNYTLSGKVSLVITKSYYNHI